MRRKSSAASLPLWIFVLLGCSASPAWPATITVNTTDDELNADGDCSLREAIQSANTDAVVDGCAGGTGADTVVVPAGTFTLSITGAFVALTVALPAA